jgi:predicted DNA-binding transcriptional regulator AlpA
MITEENTFQSDDQLLRIDDVVALTTLSKSCINLWVAQGRFPRPSSLSKTLKVWRLGDVRKWSDSLFGNEGVANDI